jgi:hypothetical protein
MIIGIDGYAGAGKDTVADILVTRGFTKVSFADELREAVTHATELPMSLFLDRSLKDKPFDTPFILGKPVIARFLTYLGYESQIDDINDDLGGTALHCPRDILKFMGTEVARERLSPSIWVDRYKERIKDLGNVVSPDCRFDNERECVKELNGTVFWVDRKGIKPEGTHVSANQKWPLDKYDVVVYNNCKMSHLHHEICLWWSLKGSIQR